MEMMTANNEVDGSLQLRTDAIIIQLCECTFGIKARATPCGQEAQSVKTEPDPSQEWRV